MSSVDERLDRRIAVLTRFIDDGPESFTDEVGRPVTVVPPSSLNKARIWDDPSLGIERIGDSASFTRLHPRHGAKVAEIDKLIRRLPKATRRGRPKTATAEAADLRRQLAIARDLVVKLTGQLAAAGAELRHERGLRVETERVLAQVRSRERKARDRQGAAALTLVGAVETGDDR